MWWLNTKSRKEQRRARARLLLELQPWLAITSWFGRMNGVGGAINLKS
jgi:hypothetical protein